MGTDPFESLVLLDELGCICLSSSTISFPGGCTVKEMHSRRSGDVLDLRYQRIVLRLRGRGGEQRGLRERDAFRHQECSTTKKPRPCSRTAMGVEAYVIKEHESRTIS